MTILESGRAPEAVEARLPAASVLEAPRRRRWTAGRWWLLLVAVAVVWSAWGSGAGRRRVVNVAGWDTMREFWSAAAKPDVSGSFLAVTVDATVTTVAFALLGTVLAVGIGVVGGVLISETWWRTDQHAGRAARARNRLAWYAGRLGLGLPRGVHEAVWALMLINVLGRDPIVGVLSIAIPFGAITAKVFADLIDAVVPEPHQALVATGAGRLSAMAYGVLPRTWPDLVSYGFYRFDCAIRSAVILGMIGAGGLGFELSLAFQALNYRQLWTSIYALVILGALVDWWGWLVRSGSRRTSRVSVAVVVVLTLASIRHLGADSTRLFSSQTWSLLGDLVRRALPPRPPTSWPDLVHGATITLQMSVLAIAIGSGLGVVTACLAARDGAGGPRRVVAWLSRLVLLVARAVSPPVWALVVLFVIFPGPLPGAIALGIYNFGVLGRLFAEVVENLDHRPAEALRASGASATAAFLYATVPMAVNGFAVYSLYRWEIAIRETAVVGVIGAGGLGRLLEERRAAFDYPSMSAIVVALLLLSLAVDLVSASARRAWRSP